MPCGARDSEGRPYGWCGQLPVVHSAAGVEYCAFHAPHGGGGVAEVEYYALLHGRIAECIKAGQGCDLRGAVIPGGMSFGNYNRERQMAEVDFSEAVFSGPVDFGHAYFGGGAVFRGARFMGRAWFYDAQFRGGADFGGAVFEDEAWFSAASFWGPMNFDRVRFRGLVSCTLTDVMAGGSMRGTEFGGVAELELVITGPEVVMEGVDVSKVIFDGTDMGKIKIVK